MADNLSKQVREAKIMLHLFPQRKKVSLFNMNVYVSLFYFLLLYHFVLYVHDDFFCQF